MEALRGAFQRGRVAIVDAWGMPGSGKSALLLHAPGQIAAPADLALRYRFSADHERAADPDKQMVADYGVFQAFAGRLAEEIGTTLEPAEDSREARLIREFELAYDEARVSGAQISAKATVLFSIVRDSDVGTVKDSSALAASVHEKRPRLASALAKLLRGVTQASPQADQRRLLLALDEFELLPEGPLRNWVIELARDLDSALVLLPRTPNVPAPESVGVDCPLARLSREEIRDFASECLPGRDVSDELVEVIEHATDGHPQAVSLAVELLQRYEVPDPPAFAAELDELPDDLAQKYGRMVEKILGRDGAEAEQTLRACAVTRKFDAALLEAVVGAEADLERLKRYSFVEEAADPREGFVRIHPVVRKELAQRLEQADKVRFVELHKRAAAHCAAWLGGFEEDEDLDPASMSYGSWYRYEDPRWQAAKREWLYHQARASAGGKEERELGRRRFCRVFFGAFWWWGCYIEFPFCRALVADWRTTQEDREWTAPLEAFLDAYPGGYEKAKAPPEWREGELPRWDAVRAALLDVREASGLGDDPATLADEEARHTRALIDTFLAHAARYRAADARAYGTALALYDEAVALYEADEDDWDTAWTRFERGELHLEHGHSDAARDDWTKAAELVPELKDEELAANLHRLAADAHAAAGDHESAFAAHGRAVLHAYLFQRRPHPPDEYTLSFYGEQVARALDRLVQHDGDLARAGELLAAPFPDRAPPDDLAALCEARDVAALAAALFPEPPAADELNRRSSRFVQRWLLAEADLGLPAPTDSADSAW